MNLLVRIALVMIVAAGLWSPGPASAVVVATDPASWRCAGVELAPPIAGDPDRNPDGSPVAISPDARGKYVPVIMVHGWTGAAHHDLERTGAFSHKIDLTTNQVGSVRADRSLIGQVQRVAGTAVFTFDYHDHSARWVDDPHIGPALGVAVDCLYRASGEKVIIIAHSMGGLATRYALGERSSSETDRADEVSTVITFGTPNTGSLIALLGDTALNVSAAVNRQLAVLRLILSTCGAAASRTLNTGTPCDILTPPLRAADSQAGRALRSGSHQLAALKPFPDKVSVHALAGETNFTVPKLGWFRLPWETERVPVGDLIVTSDSATRGADSKSTASCDYQLNPVRGATDQIGLLFRTTAKNDVARPVTGLLGPCFHGNLMRTIQLTNEATGIVNDDISARMPPTKVVTIVPVDRSGAPVAGYTVADESTTLDCAYPDISYPSPASRGRNIVTCSPTAAAADVCWTQQDRRTVLCEWDPRDKVLHRFRSTNTITDVGPADDPLPWLIELDNGAACRIRNGGSWSGRSDDLLGAYYCPDRQEVILASPEEPVVDTSKRHWTVLYGVLDDRTTGSPPPQTAKVRVAYFAGSPG